MGNLNRRQKSRARRQIIHQWIKYFLPLQAFEFKCSQCDLYYIVYNYYKCWAERFPGGHCPRCNSTDGELYHHEHNPSGLDILLSRPNKIPTLPRFKNKHHPIYKRRPREIRVPKHKPINLSQVTEFVFLCRHNGIFRILPGRKQYPKINQQQPLVSIYGASIRPELWTRFYESVMNTKVPFEIIFSGHAKHQPKMPSNFKYIYSTDSVFECIKLAVEKTKGKYLLYLGDDWVLPEMAIDRLYNFSEKINDPRVAVTFNYGIFTYQHKPWKWGIKYGRQDGGDSQMDGGFIMNRSTFFDIGMSDKYTIYFKWDYELLLRFCNSGGSIIDCKPNVTTVEIHPFGEGERLSQDSAQEAFKKLLKKLHG